jgi:hypothetical protein
MRCTGSSGQMLLHQPLLPLSSMPLPNAVTIVISSSTPSAVPLLLNSSLRAATMPRNRTTART